MLARGLMAPGSSHGRFSTHDTNRTVDKRAPTPQKPLSTRDAGNNPPLGVRTGGFWGVVPGLAVKA